MAPSRFELRRRIGAGGMGVVYEARDRNSGALVALKTLHSLNADALYRLKREFRMLQGLQHPNLCQLYELFEHDGRWFISMELIHGQSFLEFVATVDDGAETSTADVPFGQLATAAGDQPVPTFDASKLRMACLGLAEGLRALHDAGLVHRDVKPSNVLVTSSGRVVVLDFGFVSHCDGHTAHSMTVVGTPAYMAPEQALSGAVGPAADWFSVGVMMYQAMTGRLPHEGDNHVALLISKQCSAPPAPRSLVPSIPRDLDALCVELLRIAPDQRPGGAAVLRRLGGSPGGHAIATLSVSAFGGGFVGREPELDALHRAYVDSQRHAVTAVVIGTSGVGKSSLTKHFTENIEASGAIVLQGRCYERECVPYKAFDGVIDALSRYLRTLPDRDVAAATPRHLDALVRMFPVLGSVRGLGHTPVRRASASDPHEQRSRAFAALRELCRHLAAQRPLVIVVDDWQWADHDSVVLARSLMRDGDSPAALLLLSTRPPDDAEGAQRIEAASAADTRRVDVTLLQDPDGTELARRLLAAFAPGASIDPRAIADEARGHPLHIAELVRHIATHGVGDRQGMRLEEAIAARVAELPPDARTIVEALAVAGVPLPIAAVRDAVGLPAADFQRHAAVLRLAHLISTTQQETAFETYHDRVREAVAERLDPTQRVRWHRRLAETIEATPVARERPELLLRHLEASGQNERTVDLAIAAARKSHDAAAFEQASSLYRTALRLGTFEPSLRRELRRRLGEALANAGRGPEAAAEFLEAADGAGPAERLDCHRQAAEQLLISGHLDRGLAILSELLKEIGLALPATQRRALAAVAWGRTWLRLRGMRWTERHDSQVSPEVLRRLDVLRVVSHGLGMVDNIRGADFNTRWLTAALRTGEPERLALALATESVYLGSKGGKGLDRAAELVDTIGDLGRRYPDPRLATRHLSARGVLEYWTCRLPEARATLAEAEARYLELPGISWEIKNVRMFLGYALRHLGAWRELRARLDHETAAAESRGDIYVLGSMRRFGSVLVLADDDPDGARRMIDSVPWPPASRGFHVQHWYELEALGEIGLYTRELSGGPSSIEPLFEGLRRSMLLHVRIIRSMAAWLQARLALAALAGGDAREHMVRVKRAVSVLARDPDGRSALAMHLVRAALHERRGDQTRAVDELRAAIATGTASSLRLMTAVAQHRLAEMLGGANGAALHAAAAATFRDEKIVSPERFTAQHAPGFTMR